MVNSENGKECTCTESVQEQDDSTCLQPSTDHVYQDVRDGEGVQSNQLLKTEPPSVGLIRYQDAFEVVNPLGSVGKKIKFDLFTQPTWLTFCHTIDPL